MFKQIPNLKSIALAIILFLGLSIAYMAPALSGKDIKQHDIEMHKGMSKELADYSNETGKVALWTNRMFGGMPSFLISSASRTNLLRKINAVLTLKNWRPICFVFLYLLGFYLALLAFDINKWLAIVGSIAYGFSSYLIIIIVAGHATKAFSLGYLPAIIGGIHLAFNGKYLKGALMTGLFLGLQLLNSHLQITYYTLLIILIYGFYELIFTVKGKKIKQLALAIGVLSVAALLAIGSNATTLWTTAEYGGYSIRGKSELTNNSENQTTGLDRDYATRWSYGRAETFSLLYPNFMGGASYSELSQDSETYAFLSKVQGKANAKKAIKQMPTYWGKQPGTSGPVYIGSIICFLFVLGLIIVEKKHRWWILTATIISILFSWGHNLSGLTNFMFDYLPGYNKFRAVSMTLVIAGFTMPLLAMLALDKILKSELSKKEATKALKYAFGITGGLSLFFLLFAKGLFDFEAVADQQYLAQGYTEFVDALQADRAKLFRKDVLRSLLFITLSAGAIYLFIQEKLKLIQTISIIGVLVLIDMWSVDKRYLNTSHFVSQTKHDKPFVPSNADKFILEDPDPNYRVFDISSDPFNDATCSYFHNSLGGYHGAKMRRYQELIEYGISPDYQRLINSLQSGDINNIEQTLANSQVLNMLNTKYIIYSKEGQPLVNKYRHGNAWFVSDYKIVENSDEEISALKTLNTKTSAIIDKRFVEYLSNKSFSIDSLASIKLEEYQPNSIRYKSNTTAEQLAIFSEIYYPAGWEVSIDGEPAEHFRANYVLRGMVIPKGEHTIEFSFKPKSYYAGEKISFASSLIFILLLVGLAGWEIKKQIKKED